MPVSPFPAWSGHHGNWERELGVHAKGFSGTPWRSGHAQRWRVDHQYVLGHGHCRQPQSPAYRPPRLIAIFTKSATALCEGEYPHQFGTPGYADTPLTVQRFNDPAVRQMLLDRTPMGRLGTAEDIANGVLFWRPTIRGSPARNW
jgi:hypothetical protein